MKSIYLVVLFFLPFYGLESNNANILINNNSAIMQDEKPIKIPKRRVYSDSISIIKLSNKKSFTLKLASNPSTGFSWKIFEELDAEFVQLKQNVYVADKVEWNYDSNQNGGFVAVGSGGFEYWTFKPQKKGTFTIKLLYSRTASKSGEPKIFTVEVD